MGHKTSNRHSVRHADAGKTSSKPRKCRKRADSEGKRDYARVVETWTCCECYASAWMSVRLIDSCPNCYTRRCAECPISRVWGKNDGTWACYSSEPKSQPFQDNNITQARDADSSLSSAPQHTRSSGEKAELSSLHAVRISQTSNSSNSPQDTPSSGDMSEGETEEPSLEPSRDEENELFESFAELEIRPGSSENSSSARSTLHSGIDFPHANDDEVSSQIPRSPSRQPCFSQDRNSSHEIEFLDIILGRFVAWQAAGSPEGQASAGPSNSSSGTSTSPRSTRSGANKRRRRSDKSRASEKNVSGSDSEDNGGSSVKPKKRSRQEGGPPPFACPFWKADPRKHGPCLTKTLNRVRDVKLHLRRCHFTPYCLQCGREQVDRLCQPLCEPKRFYLETLSWEQCEKFKRAARVTAREQWFVVWDLIFPQRRRPDSPYLDDEVSRTFLELRQFFHLAGHRVARDVGVAMGLMPSDASESDNWLGHAVEAVFTRLFDERLQQRPVPLTQQPHAGTQIAEETYPVAEAEPAPSIGFDDFGELPIVPAGYATFAPAGTSSRSGVASIEEAAPATGSGHSALIDTSWAFSDGLLAGVDEGISYAFNVTLTVDEAAGDDDRFEFDDIQGFDLQQDDLNEALDP